MIGPVTHQIRKTPRPSWSRSSELPSVKRKRELFDLASDALDGAVPAWAKQALREAARKMTAQQLEALLALARAVPSRGGEK